MIEVSQDGLNQSISRHDPDLPLAYMPAGVDQTAKNVSSDLDSILQDLGSGRNQRDRATIDYNQEYSTRDNQRENFQNAGYSSGGGLGIYGSA